MNNSPIGIFDSGVGGLTVLEALIKKLPNEEFIYFGDTAHLPYGNKAPETVLQYARDNGQFLVAKGIKLLVVACHTACAHALHQLQQELPVPVIGVTEPGCDLLLTSTRSKRVAILATAGTIASKTVEHMLLAKDPSVTIFPQACPLFVPLVEEGFHFHPSTHLIAHHYLDSLIEKNIDAALLACTHYPIIKDVIATILGASVALIEPADATAAVVQRHLEASQSLRSDPSPPVHQFFASEDPEKLLAKYKIFMKA